MLDPLGLNWVAVKYDFSKRMSRVMNRKRFGEKIGGRDSL